jgi:hypothetical protein
LKGDYDHGFGLHVREEQVEEALSYCGGYS